LHPIGSPQRAAPRQHPPAAARSPGPHYPAVPLRAVAAAAGHGL